MMIVFKFLIVLYIILDAVHDIYSSYGFDLINKRFVMCIACIQIAVGIGLFFILFIKPIIK